MGQLPSEMVRDEVHFPCTETTVSETVHLNRDMRLFSSGKPKCLGIHGDRTFVNSVLKLLTGTAEINTGNNFLLVKHAGSWNAANQHHRY